jgi:hypothetical protein
MIEKTFSRLVMLFGQLPAYLACVSASEHESLQSIEWPAEGHLQWLSSADVCAEAFAGMAFSDILLTSPRSPQHANIWFYGQLGTHGDMH